MNIKNLYLITAVILLSIQLKAQMPKVSVIGAMKTWELPMTLTFGWTPSPTTPSLWHGPL